METHTTKFHYGEQSTYEWHKLRLGNFTSSTIHQLFSEPTKQNKANLAMVELKRNLWPINKEVVDYRPNNTSINYAIKYLVSFGFGSNIEFEKAKKALKEYFKHDSFCFINLDDFSITQYEDLLLRACYAIDNIDVFGGSATTLIKEKANEIIYGEPKEELEGVRALEWGKENEPLASKFFQEKTLNFCDSGSKKIAFVSVNEMATGTSPDDTIDGFIPSEYKCPINRNKHYDHTKIKNSNDLFNFDKQKYYQMMHQMWVLKSEFGYWSSFHPHLLRKTSTRHKALHTIKVRANNNIIKQFPKLIKQAELLRDKFVLDFLSTEDVELWNY